MNIEGERMRAALVVEIKKAIRKHGSMGKVAAASGVGRTTLKSILSGASRNPTGPSYRAFGLVPPPGVSHAHNSRAQDIAPIVDRYRREGRKLILARIAAEAGCCKDSVRCYLETIGLISDAPQAAMCRANGGARMRRANAQIIERKDEHAAAKRELDAERATRYAPPPVPPPMHSLADEVKAHLKRERSLRQWARQRGPLLERDPGLGQALAAVAAKRKVRGGRDGWRNCVTIDPAQVKAFWKERMA